MNSNYQKIVSYSYDACGNILEIKDAQNNLITDSNNIAYINPFRYRSYYYDEETKLCYLNNRYYNPEWGRFINADNYILAKRELLSYNMYSYANNNPVYFKGPAGNAFLLAFGIGFGVGLVVNCISNAIKKNTKKQEKKAKKEIEKVQQKKNVPDMTEKFDAKLKESASVIKDEVGNIPVVELYNFSTLVGGGGKYDLKTKDEWKQTISYNGIIMEPQDLGNYHYGYVGRAAGFDIVTLKLGLGLPKLLTIGKILSHM